MNKTIDKLQKMFSPENRYATFGDILLGLDIKGIKGTNCHISFDFPVTAIAGYNGAGKSTIAQIALCMYRASENEPANDRKYLKDYFVKTLLDKEPYQQDACIIARYSAPKERSHSVQLSLFEEEEPILGTKEIRVYYAGDRWAGYKHQPQRTVYYYGMSYFIPYQEQNSNLLRDSNANIAKHTDIKPGIVKQVAEILSIQYEALHANSISNVKRTESVLSASQPSATYSENHMGCGEGRLLKLVCDLENAPEKSLFVIEEPETALHQLAQYKLAKYFIDICSRKNHQIIFTTHSPEIQRALPPQARKYIQRDGNGHTSVVNSPSIAQIQNCLSGGHEKKMIVVTEDEVGKCYIMEILRAFNPTVFENCEFFSMDLGFKEIKNYVKYSQKCGVKIIGIVDENRRKDIPNYVIAFPEDTPPEVSFFSDSITKEQICNEFAFDPTSLPSDHHDYFASIANSKRENSSYVMHRAIKLYIKNKGAEYFREITELMSKWLCECDI